VPRDWPQWYRRSGPIHGTFNAKSADPGYFFSIDVDGRWQARRTHHTPESVAISYVIEQVGRLAGSVSLLEHSRLQHQANDLLGRPVSLPRQNIRVLWASVHVHASPHDAADLLEAQRRSTTAKRADEEIRLRISRIITFRDGLREDPTLALAQMMLESPAKVTPETLATIESIAKYVATYAPGAEVVAVAQMLRDFTADLKPDAKQFIADRLCTVLIEFGGEAPAHQIRGLVQSDE